MISLRHAVAIFAAVITLTCSAQSNYAKFDRYAAANDSLITNSISPRIVFMGNSITDFWPREHAAFFTANNYVGRGISGQTSYEMLSRFRQDVVSLKPLAVVISAGTNDIAENMFGWYDEERTFGNIISMAEIARANGIEVYLASVLPVTEFKWAKHITDIQAKITSLNNRIKAYAEANNLKYVDYHSAMANPDGTMPDAYSADGVHPNTAGYAVMEQVLLNTL